jgi:hypothetical protein
LPTSSYYPVPRLRLWLSPTPSPSHCLATPKGLATEGLLNGLVAAEGFGVVKYPTEAKLSPTARTESERSHSARRTSPSPCGLKSVKEAFVSVFTTDCPGLKQQMHRRATAMGKPLKVANAGTSNCPDYSINPSVETCKPISMATEIAFLWGATSGCGCEGEVGP